MGKVTHSHLSLRKQESGREKTEDGLMSTSTAVLVLVTTPSLPKTARALVVDWISLIACLRPTMILPTPITTTSLHGGWWIPSHGAILYHYQPNDLWLFPLYSHSLLVRAKLLGGSCAIKIDIVAICWLSSVSPDKCLVISAPWGVLYTAGGRDRLTIK